MIVIFWLTCFIIFYHIVLYGLILKLLNKSKKIKLPPILESYPTATMICPAYNEEENIAGKIESFLKVDYPKDRINLIFVSDDSEDDTNRIVSDYEKRYDNIKLVIQKPRAGKPSAQNLVEPTIKSEIVFLSDASSILKKDSLSKLIRHFQDSRVGLVASKLIYLEKERGTSSGEGLYWKYETWLRYLESEFHSISVSSGALFALRRQLFTQIHPASPDDFERTLIVMENGFRAHYETESIVSEFLEDRNSDEIKRKIRVVSREWFALFRHSKLLNPFIFPKESFILISHKLIRWLIPLFSVCILTSNLFLLNNFFYKIFMLSHILLYVVGVLELHLSKEGKTVKFFKLPGYWVAMNYAAFVAFVKFLMGKQQNTWETNHGK